MIAWWARYQAWAAQQRRARQRRDIRSRLLRAWSRLDELRHYVDRDRRAERSERDRLIRQLDEARARLGELEHLLRTYMVCQSLLDAEQAAGRAREALVSGFGDLEQKGPGA